MEFYVSIACETVDHGLVIEDVEAKVKQYAPKMIYVIPTFQNPSGRTMSVERLAKVIRSKL